MTKRKPLKLTLGMLVIVGAMLAIPATALGDSHNSPDGEWTSMFEIPVSGDAVPDGGEPGASGTFWLWINSNTETIYYEIELFGVNPPYESPALTATHIHEGPARESGPPRVIFDDPEPQADGSLWSSGTVQGPFVTGLDADDGSDHGDGFSLAEIEANPSAFYVDTHTADYPAGAARGQFGEPIPMMPAAGRGGAAESGSMLSMTILILAGTGALAVLGLFGLTRRRSA
jgi:hypothetical protein